MKGAMASLVALAAAAVFSYSADAQSSVAVTVLKFKNETDQQQTQLWVDFTGEGALWFNAARSTSGWSCTEFAVGIKWDCSGTAVPVNGTVKLAFGHGCTETLTCNDWGWGPRGGTAQPHNVAGEVGTCSVEEVQGCSVGGIAELPDVSGSSGPPYAVLAGGPAAVLALGAGAWYATRRSSRQCASARTERVSGGGSQVRGTREARGNGKHVDSGR